MFPWWPGGGLTAQLPLQKASLPDLLTLCLSPSHSSPHPLCHPLSRPHPCPFRTGWQRLIDQLVEFLISEYFQSCCHARQKASTESLDQGHLAVCKCGCDLQACLFCFISQYAVVVCTGTKVFSKCLHFTLTQNDFRPTLHFYMATVWMCYCHFPQSCLIVNLLEVSSVQCCFINPACWSSKHTVGEKMKEKRITWMH